MNRYYLIKTNGETKIDKELPNNSEIKCVEITKEINEEGVTQNGFLTEIIDELKENN